ncbi:MAG: inositol monophosphatase family protein [Panacagrimonas sp.]
MYSAQLSVARQAAAAASELIRKAYRGNFKVSIKADATPVTEVDVAAEKAIHAVLHNAFPGYGFYGEETGAQDMDAEFLWLVDPIDGTKSFVRGYPMFSVQIGLMHRGELVVGVSAAPCWNGEGEIAWAERGKGAFLDGQPIRVSDAARIEQIALSTGNLARLAASPAWARFGAIVPRLQRIRGYGDFLHYHLLASGKIDAVVESDVNILDIAALSVIVQEAGGRMTELCGRPLRLETRTVLAATPELHAQLLKDIDFSDSDGRSENVRP